MIAAKIDRFWRFMLLGFIMSLLFPDARAFIMVVLIASVYFYLTIKKFDWSRPIVGLIAIALFAGLFGLNQFADAQMEAATQDALQVVEDGSYTGQAEGHRDIVEVDITISGGEITEVVVSENDTPDYGDAAAEEMSERIIAEQTIQVDTVSGATVTSEAIIEAGENALDEAAGEGTAQPGALVSVISFFTTGLWAGTTLFQLMVVFIIIVFIDFTLQGVLVPNTGQSLNCMNCQACVGVCPVRHVEEDNKPLPMQMALASRLGDYDEVNRLLQYCVGCGRCSGRCPNGVSPVMLGGSSKVIHDELRGEED
ncbi:FMN-binding protein [Natranaerofaba carboxydovora]|uniref:FMN-binding protein n=1 Tax=Natranaerofaba carboxydovora TaxID=2742683 RepID=UPI001F132877|nr:FMN-binding protein [Natranaerofaba carboxydovora]UMZ74093.1 FMN-binding domain protein [Natranaerofaba carboxydovora]